MNYFKSENLSTERKPKDTELHVPLRAPDGIFKSKTWILVDSAVPEVEEC